MNNEVPIPAWAEAELILALAEAENRALAGAVLAGRQLLTRRMEEAEGYVLAGEPWGRRLHHRWRRAIYDYLREHRQAADL